jgi:hypothetical protein
VHNALKKMATADEGKGCPARLQTESNVVDVDCENMTVKLEDGTEVAGDLVIVADGVNVIHPLPPPLLLPSILLSRKFPPPADGSSPDSGTKSSAAL